MGLMPTYDAMLEQHQVIVRDMSDMARQAMSENGFKPLNDDRCAVFDEACAVFLNESLIEGKVQCAVRL